MSPSKVRANEVEKTLCYERYFFIQATCSMNAKGQTRRARDDNLNLLKLVVAQIYKASKLVIYNVSPYGDSILARVPPLKRTEALLRLAAA